MYEKIKANSQETQALKALLARNDPQHVFTVQTDPFWGVSLAFAATAALPAALGLSVFRHEPYNQIAWGAALLFGALGLFLALQRFVFGVAPGLHVLSIGLIEATGGGSLKLWRQRELKAYFGRQSRQTRARGLVSDSEGGALFVPMPEVTFVAWERACRAFAQTDFKTWLSLVSAPGATTGAPPQGGAPVASRVPARAGDDASRAIREVIARNPRPDEGRRAAASAPFAQIAHAMESAGLRLVSHIEQGVTLDPKPRDPIRADYAANGADAFYFRNAETGLQTVQVVGPRANEVFNDILNVGYLPVLHSKIDPMLRSESRADVIRALGAVEFMYAGNPGKYYRDDLLRLAQHADPEIRAAAARARANVPADQA